MKCKNCNAELIKTNEYLYCQYCGAKIYNFEIEETKPKKEVFNVRGGVLIEYRGNSNIIRIPESIKAIGDRCFLNDIQVEKVIFTDSIVYIGENAFEGCINLKSIENYEKIKEFRKECFKNSGLKEITISENVELLGEECFSHMPNLESVIYNPEKDLILKNTFRGSVNLSSVKMDKKYFFPGFTIANIINGVPSLLRSNMVKNNPGNTRPTYADAFKDTKYYEVIKDFLLKKYKEGICPDCGGIIKKGLFHARCVDCKIDYRCFV